MGLRVVVVGSALASIAFGACAARADALVPETAVEPQPAPYVFWPVDEVRLGVYAHNWIHDEDAPVDVSVEALSSPLAFPGYDVPGIAGNPWISWFFDPRFNIGGMINTGGKTSYGFGGFTWRIPIFGPVFFEGELGGALNDAVRQPTPDRVDMGCVATFRESGGFGVQLSQNVDFIVNIEHISHASFCSKINPGITDVGFRVGYKF